MEKEPGRLQSRGSWRVGQNLGTEHLLQTKLPLCLFYFVQALVQVNLTLQTPALPTSSSVDLIVVAVIQ